MKLKVRTENPVFLPLVIYFILFLAKKLELKNIGVVNTTLTTPAPTPLCCTEPQLICWEMQQCCAQQFRFLLMSFR